MYGDSNYGWLRFLGGGRFDAAIDFMNLEFQGTRVPGQGTRSDIDARALRAEWDGYNVDEYERESRARWR